MWASPAGNYSIDMDSDDKDEEDESGIEITQSTPIAENGGRSYVNIILRSSFTAKKIAPVINAIHVLNMVDDAYAESIPLNGGVEGDEVEMPALRASHINLFITSSGGDSITCKELIATIESSSIPVRTIVMSSASSAGFITFLAGHERVAHPIASFMSHYPIATLNGQMSIKTALHKEFKAVAEEFEKIYLRYTGLPMKTIRSKLLKDDTDMKLNFDQMRELGLIDIELSNSNYDEVIRSIPIKWIRNEKDR
jgi:ATP-dependent protease ClpP protease subunit